MQQNHKPTGLPSTQSSYINADMNTLQQTTLDNGLRIITDSVKSVESVALGIWASVGTRNEDSMHNGTAHMVEHMIFKGTERRNAAQIVEKIENVGGHMNAYTSREVTSYHIHLLKEHAGLALDTLADMYQNSTMPEDEVERERHVILQEIGMCNDTPDDLIFDNYYETAYQGQALGAPILGTSDIISKMSRETLMEYAQRFYHPGNTVISAAGNIDHDKFVRDVEQNFQTLPSAQNDNINDARYTSGEHRLQKNLEQSHIILGFQGVNRTHEHYYHAQALSSLLGGGMSSRLFQEIREKRGLCYSIYSFHSSYSDSGQFGIYAGTGPNDLGELVPVLCGEVQKAMQNISEGEVQRAKSQLKSSLLMGRESMMSRADQQAKYLIYHDKALNIEHVISCVESITRQDLQKTAELIFSQKPTLAALGPLEKLESFEKITERFAA